MHHYVLCMGHVRLKHSIWHIHTCLAPTDKPTGATDDRHAIIGRTMGQRWFK